MRRLAPRPLAAALEGVLARAEPATTLARVQSVWPRVAGSALADSARPVAERDGVVTLACESAVWANELELLAGELLPRLNAALAGPGKGADGQVAKAGAAAQTLEPGTGAAAQVVEPGADPEVTTSGTAAPAESELAANAEQGTAACGEPGTALGTDPGAAADGSAGPKAARATLGTAAVTGPRRRADGAPAVSRLRCVVGSGPNRS